MIQLAPSRLHRNMVCSASIVWEPTFPGSKPGRPALEGRASHWLAQQAYLNSSTAEPWVGQDTHGVTIEADMATHVGTYLQDIWSNAGDAATLETPVTMERGNARIKGYVDCNWYNVTDGVLHIWELKYGYGLVEVKENWQMIGAAVALLNAWYESGHDISCVKTVQFHMVQPRPWHPQGKTRTWSFPAELWRNYANLIFGQAERAEHNPEATTGAHCLYCKVGDAGVCPALNTATMSAIDITMGDPVYELTPEAHAAQYELLKRAKDIINTRFASLEQMAIDKGGVPGYQVEHPNGAMAWKPGMDPIVVALGMGADIKAPEKPLTPAQCRDRKLLALDTIKALTETKSGKAKLVPVNHDHIKEILDNG